jgi:hypothetical protein
LRSLEGRIVGVSSWLEMTQGRVGTFAEATGILTFPKYKAEVSSIIPGDGGGEVRGHQLDR